MNNNMNKTTTFVGQHIFSQILSLSSKASLSSIFNETKANKWYKSIKAWDHYATMMFAVLSNCSSLRENRWGLKHSAVSLITWTWIRYHRAVHWQMPTRGAHLPYSAKFIRHYLPVTGLICRTALPPFRRENEEQRPKAAASRALCACWWLPGSPPNWQAWQSH